MSGHVTETLTAQIAKVCDQQREGLIEIVSSIVAQIEAPRAEADDSEDRRILDRIKAKDFCSPAEGAALLGCSAQHLRNLADRAIKGQADVPIPYADLDGVLTFPVKELLQWARLPKSRARKGTKNKTHLQAVAGGKQL